MHVTFHYMEIASSNTMPKLSWKFIIFNWDWKWLDSNSVVAQGSLTYEVVKPYLSTGPEDYAVKPV